MTVGAFDTLLNKLFTLLQENWNDFLFWFLAMGTRKFSLVWESSWRWISSWSEVTLTSPCSCLPGEKSSRGLTFQSQVGKKNENGVRNNRIKTDDMWYVACSFDWQELLQVYCLIFFMNRLDSNYALKVIFSNSSLNERKWKYIKPNCERSFPGINWQAPGAFWNLKYFRVTYKGTQWWQSHCWIWLCQPVCLPKFDSAEWIYTILRLQW